MQDAGQRFKCSAARHVRSIVWFAYFNLTVTVFISV